MTYVALYIFGILSKQLRFLNVLYKLRLCFQNINSILCICFLLELSYRAFSAPSLSFFAMTVPIWKTYYSKIQYQQRHLRFVDFFNRKIPLAYRYPTKQLQYMRTNAFSLFETINEAILFQLRWCQCEHGNSTSEPSHIPQFRNIISKHHSLIEIGLKLCVYLKQ